ncbi:MAG: hypothetical protein OEW00_02890 [candidate division Zixibacteria bacterium]|nr:hypothetical protein [candidate division Zixibacteria bacterium]
MVDFSNLNYLSRFHARLSWFSVGRRSRRYGFLLSCLVAVCFISVCCEAVELTGRLTSSLYGWERSGDTYWRSYVGFNSTAKLWRNSQLRSLSLHTNLRWTGDLAASEPGTPQTYIYDLYFRLSGYPAGSAIYAGRQFAYNTLGSSLIDGIRAGFRIVKSVNLDLFGGATVSHETPDKIQSLSQYGLFGSRVEYSRSRWFRLGLNWLARTSNGSVSRHRAGIDVWREIGRGELYSRVSYDLLDLDMAGVLVRVAARPDKWYLSAEFDWRKPSVDGNTVFSMIDADAYKGIRLEVTRALWRDIRVLGQFHRELLKGVDSWRSAFGLRTTHFMVAWHHRDGYGGESDGIQGQASVNFRRNLELYGSAFVSRYLIQPETPDKIDAYSSSAGLLWRPGRAIQVRVEGQYLRHAVDKNDFRIFIGLAKYFKVSADESEVAK